MSSLKRCFDLYPIVTDKTDNKFTLFLYLLSLAAAAASNNYNKVHHNHNNVSFPPWPRVRVSFARPSSNTKVSHDRPFPSRPLSLLTKTKSSTCSTLTTTNGGAATSSYLMEVHLPWQSLKKKVTFHARTSKSSTPKTTWTITRGICGIAIARWPSRFCIVSCRTTV